jgi:hypothetical protein
MALSGTGFSTIFSTILSTTFAGLGALGLELGLELGHLGLEMRALDRHVIGDYDLSAARPAHAAHQ